MPMPSASDLFQSFARSYEARRESELSLSEYLEIARIILSRLGCNRYPHVCRSAAGRPGDPAAAAGAASGTPPGSSR
jgi:hypothetical protein